MYPIILATHSLTRWLILISLLYVIYRAYKGWISKRPFSRLDNFSLNLTVIIAYIQLVEGIWLYFTSPIIHYFLHHFKEAVPQNEFRFFGMEHSLVMITAIVIIVIGAAKTKRKKTGNEKFKTMAVWFSIALLMILSSVPWVFSPYVSRPYFRAF